MPADIEQLLADAAAEPSGPVDTTALRRRVRRARRRERVLAGMCVLVVVTAGVVAVTSRTGSEVAFAPADTDGNAPAPPPGPEGGTRMSIPAGWSALPPSPLSARHSATAIVVGDEVVVLGGRATPLCPPAASCLPPEEPPLSDGAAYDVATGRWRRLAAAPLPLNVAAAAVLDDVVYLLTTDHDGADAFLSYAVAEDAWELLPSPDTPWLRLVALADGIAGVQPTHEPEPAADLWYDPQARTWTPLPPDPNAPAFDRAGVAVDGRLVVLGIPLVDQPGQEPSSYRAAIFDPADVGWEDIAEPPADQAIGFWGPDWFAVDGLAVNPHLGSSDGGETNTYDRAYPHGGILDPTTGTWRHLSEAPAPRHSAPHHRLVAGSNTAVVADGWLLRPATGEWVPIDDDVQLPTGGHAVALLGEVLFVWGGGDDDGELSADGWLWSPRAAPTRRDSAAALPWTVLAADVATSPGIRRVARDADELTEAWTAASAATRPPVMPSNGAVLVVSVPSSTCRATSDVLGVEVTGDHVVVVLDEAGEFTRPCPGPADMPRGTVYAVAVPLDQVAPTEVTIRLTSQ
jgi:hypothetical protein